MKGHTVVSKYVFVKDAVTKIGELDTIGEIGELWDPDHASKSEPAEDASQWPNLRDGK